MSPIKTVNVIKFSCDSSAQEDPTQKLKNKSHAQEENELGRAEWVSST
jgi:hypothetical protein